MTHEDPVSTSTRSTSTRSTSPDGISDADASPAARSSDGELVSGRRLPNVPYREELSAALEAAEAGSQVLRRYFRTDGLRAREKRDHDFVCRADEESEAAILGVLRRAFPDYAVLAEESAGEARDPAGAPGQWIVDPLDGTANFLQGLPVFCISIACRVDDETVVGVVLDPMGDNVFSATLGGGARWNGQAARVSPRPGLHGSFLATGYPFRAKEALDTYLGLFRDLFFRSRGIRRCGAAALDLAYTAAGVYDGFFEFRLSPWDIAAGDLLVREAGGVVTDLDGGEDLFRGHPRSGIFRGNVLAGAPGVHRELLAAVSEHVDEATLDRVSPFE